MLRALCATQGRGESRTPLTPGLLQDYHLGHDSRIAARFAESHAMVRLVQEVGRTEDSARVADGEQRADRISYPSQLVQGKTAAPEPASCVLCRKERWAGDFGRRADHLGPKCAVPGLP